MDKYIEPVRIVCSENCEAAENVFKALPPQAGFCKDDSFLIKAGGYILLDFGKEIHGCVLVTTLDISIRPVLGRIVYGESVSEALSSVGEKNATNAHAIRDMKVEVMPWSTVKYGETGFRFAKIEAIDGDIRVKTIKAVPDILDIEKKGSFECDDERLNKIWEVAAYTVQLNMHEYLWDGIKRDRLVWIGDMHPEVSTIRNVFGNAQCVTKSLDFVRDETKSDEWMNSMPTYSMWWLIIHYDWFMHWGDFKYLKEQIPCAKAIVDMAISWINSGYDCTDFKTFVDWGSRYSAGELDGAKAVFCMGLDAASRIFEVMGEATYCKKCKDAVLKMRNEKVTVEANKSMSALTVLSGRDNALAKKVILDNSLTGISTFMGYYVLLAKADLEDMNGALDIIRNYWGAMLDLGATTFWEDFDMSWIEGSAPIDELVPEGKKDIHGDFGKFCYEGFRHSLCHGWASGPAAFLTQKIAGVEILEPGCKKVKISPDLGNLNWAKISYPTPFGSIKIDIRKEDANISVNIQSPTEIEIV